MSATQLFDFAQDLLTLCEQALATTTAGTPDRSFITVEQPAIDCPEQLTVHVIALEIDQQLSPNQGAAGGLRLVEGYRNLATYQVTVTRCTPQMQQGLGSTVFPSPSDLTALAQTTTEDLWAIWNAVANAVDEGTLFNGCSVTSIRVSVPQAESGQSAGWRFLVQTAVYGYDPL